MTLSSLTVGQEPTGPSPFGGRIGVPIPTPAQITALVDSHERYTQSLRKRMEDDWNLMILAGSESDTDGEGYRSYTSNEPMTYFNKITAALSSGKIKIRIPVERARREKRERESAKERFIVGILKANDERLLRLGEPLLQDSLATFIDLRGWYCGRALLVRDPSTNETYADITPWDPMHVAWSVGPRGLKWVCHKSKKTVAEIQDEYGVRIAGGKVITGTGSLNGGATAEQYFQDQTLDEGEGVDVYDWWDEVNNIVVVGGEYVKSPTLHGNSGVPTFFGAVGPLPLIQSRSFMGRDNLTHRGESIFAANRHIYKKLNLVYSTMLTLVALSRNQAFTFTSRDGTKTVDKNPSLEGSQIPLAEGESIDILPLLEMSKDTGAFLGLISGEIQRGALPYSSYGQLAFQLSGYAVNLLKQATDAPMLPRKQAMENAYLQIANGICDQFATGAYGALHLRGWAQNRDWFDETFEPDMMRGLPAPEVKLVVKTPQDDLQKMQLAAQAREGPWPALPDRVIWDEILEMDDTDSLADAIREQQAERLLPEAALYTLMLAAENQGRPDLAMFYYGQLIKQGIMLPPRPWTIGQNGSAGGGASAPGFSPENLSAPEQGAVDTNVAPNPQPGPNVPPQSPRPRAVGQL